MNVPNIFKKLKAMSLGQCIQSIVVTSLFLRIFTSSVILENSLWRNIAIPLKLVDFFLSFVLHITSPIRQVTYSECIFFVKTISWNEAIVVFKITESFSVFKRPFLISQVSWIYIHSLVTWVNWALRVYNLFSSPFAYYMENVTSLYNHC